jgi:hypothetical protein
MLCSLLRAVKVFFVGNALFSSQVMVHLDTNRTVAGVTYHLEHVGLRLDHTVTLVHDVRYQSCFKGYGVAGQTVVESDVYVSPEVKDVLRSEGGIPTVAVTAASVAPTAVASTAAAVAPTMAPTAAVAAAVAAAEPKRVLLPNKGGEPSPTHAISPIMTSRAKNVSSTNQTTSARRPIPTSLLRSKRHRLHRLHKLHKLHAVPVFLRVRSDKHRARRVLSRRNASVGYRHRVRSVNSDSDSDSEAE